MCDANATSSAKASFARAECQVRAFAADPRLQFVVGARHPHAGRQLEIGARERLVAHDGRRLGERVAFDRGGSKALRAQPDALAAPAPSRTRSPPQAPAPSAGAAPPPYRARCSAAAPFGGALQPSPRLLAAGDRCGVRSG